MNQNNVEEVEALYRCPVCKLVYKEKEWAQKCMDWCRVHQSCNVEIIAHALDLRETDTCA